jgi:hypothetical protein
LVTEAFNNGRENSGHRVNNYRVNTELTMEMKTLIVKTFGLSQIIYNMQSYGFKNTDLINTERIIFQISVVNE